MTAATSETTPATGLPTGRICLVDDHAEFRQSAAWWLESLGYEVECWEEPKAFLDAMAERPAEPACFLLDVRMPEMSGLELMDAARERGLTQPVVFMTGHGDVPLAVEAMRRGAVTFLEKPFQEQALEDAIALAFRSGPTVAAEVDPSATPGALAYQERLGRLTAREREVMDLVVAGAFNKVIAYELGISPKTVELHRARIMTKMEAPTLTHLVRMAVSGQVEEG
jgi:two-component system, LuxR family, response regulator FixJ